MRVRYSTLALSELDSILARIAADDPEAAARMSRRVERIVERIVRFPKGGQAVAGRPDIRRVPLVRYPYALYYQIKDGEVVILRIMHGARRQPWEGL